MTTPLLSGQCVVISGGARGIGAGLVTHFAQAGATVVFGDIDAEGARELREKLGPLGPSTHFVEADFTGDDAWPRLREEVERLRLRADLVVANVGLGLNQPLEETPLEAWDPFFHANVRSGWQAAREFRAHLRNTAPEAGGRSLILVGSVMASFGTMGHSLYTTSKAALEGLLRALCVELAPDGIRVNMIVPGYIINDPPPRYRKALPPALWRAFHERFGEEAALANPPPQPLAFWGTPADIAHAAGFLHSPQARYITGTALRVDGGLLCQGPIVPGKGNDGWKWTPEMEAWVKERVGDGKPDDSAAP